MMLCGSMALAKTSVHTSLLLLPMHQLLLLLLLTRILLLASLPALLS